MADQDKNSIKDLMQQAMDKAEPAIQKAKEKVEPQLKKAREKVEPQIKKAREKVEPQLKKAKEKAEPTLKKAKEKAAPAINRAVDSAAKAVAKTEVYIQFDSHEIRMDEVLEKVRSDYVEKGHTVRQIKSLRVYIKPQERAAYYVANQDDTGRVDL